MSLSQLPYVSAAAAGVVALAAVFRRRPTLSEWAFAAGMAILAAESAAAGKVASALTLDAAAWWHQARLVILSLVPGSWLLFSLSYARGNAKAFVRRWRTVWIIAFAAPPAVALFFRGQLVNPTATGSAPAGLQLPGVALYTLALLTSVLIVMNLERTFRASVGTMRWRIKFMLLGVGLIFVVRGYTTSQSLLFRSVDSSLEVLNCWALLLGSILIPRSFFRTGQFHLDVYPSHSLLQGSLTVLLAGTYLLIVGALAKMVTYLGGDAAFSLKAFVVLVSLVGLATLLQSDRLHVQMRHFVSRHLQRPLYDYRTVWRNFTEGTASRLELPDLSRSLVRLLADMLNALSVTIWLVDERDGTLYPAASTFLTEPQGISLRPGKGETMAILNYFQNTADPVDIEKASDSWAESLRQMHPVEFRTGGDRVCIRLLGRGDVVGLIVIGDRVGGAELSLQDLEMLKCAADHASASVLNSQLSQRLLQNKELEAFQTMAAFFVHDLKNAASTLNLMLQNLPVHFDDPAFREDALRGVGKSVAHINNLVGRLGMLRSELRIQPVPSDLNEVVARAIADFESDPGLAVMKEYAALPLVVLDAEQVSKVVTNLVLNAKDAMSGKGQVRLTTSQNNGWAILSVADKGCGMEPEFIQRSLFRPFQTTKKNGLGIGMFQSRMIVEAHGGRITASSEPGKGTTFQIFLPVGSRPGTVTPFVRND